MRCTDRAEHSLRSLHRTILRSLSSLFFYHPLYERDDVLPPREDHGPRPKEDWLRTLLECEERWSPGDKLCEVGALQLLEPRNYKVGVLHEPANVVRLRTRLGEIHHAVDEFVRRRNTLCVYASG